MGLFGGKKSSEPTRREMAASRRQSASPGDIEAPTATSQAFRRSRNITNRPNIEESDRGCRRGARPRAARAAGSAACRGVRRAR